MQIEKPTEPQNIAKEFYIGHTHIRICTDYCCKREDVPAVLERIAGHALEAFEASAENRARNAD